MNVVGSCGWLEYLAEGPNTSAFAAAIEDEAHLLVPSLSIYEVFKRVLVQRGEVAALEVAARMMEAQVIDLDGVLALQAAKLSVAHHLPMADSVMLATARACEATLWTQARNLDGLEGVDYVPKVP